MDGLKMAQRSNPASSSGLPSILGESSSLSRNGHPTRARLSAQSNAGTAVTANSLPANLESVLDIDEGLDLGRIRLERRSHKQLLPPSVRHMADSVRSRSGFSIAHSYFSPQFDPLPYQAQYFKSSTLLKMVPVPRRHQEMFTEKQPAVPREKPLIIHSERYQYNEPLKPGYERLSQRDRLMAERQYMQRLKMQKQARETLPHREARDLLMGGQQAKFSERFDVKDELRRLKAIVLPVNARELYHGKGIQLPPFHSSVKPRYKMPPPLPEVSPEPEEEMVKEAALYRHSRTSLDGLKPKKSYRKPRQIKSKIESELAARQPMTAAERSAPISRLSNASNLTGFMLPENDGLPDPLPSPAGVEESDSEMIRPLESREAPPTRAESEMDIVLQNAAQSPIKSATIPKTPLKAPTPNPLKAADLSVYQVSEEEMKTVFRQLDTDGDGHLMYPQVEPQFPVNINKHQHKYLKQIYDITSASTFFGLKEFVTLKCLCEEVGKLDHELMLMGYEQLNIQTLNTSIIQYTELFQQIDRTSKGKITLNSLEDVLCSAHQGDRAHIQAGLNKLTDVLQLESDSISKVKFIAGIPYFMVLHMVQPAV